MPEKLADRLDRLTRTEERLNAERNIPLDRYREEGCDSRYEYLCGLAENVGVGIREILSIVDMMGPDEDFDGTKTFIEDHADQIAGGAE
jgi:hypothetical protein